MSGFFQRGLLKVHSALEPERFMKANNSRVFCVTFVVVCTVVAEGKYYAYNILQTSGVYITIH